MKKYRFFVDSKSHTARNFLITDKTTVGHISLVLRLKKGDEIILFDGFGTEYEAKIGYIDKKQVAGLILRAYQCQLPDKPKVLLAQSLPRAGKMDDIVRMNTEAGIIGFILFESENSIPKVEDYTETKVEHLKKVAQEALRQSEGVLLPEFKGPIKFNDLLKADADKKIILHSRDVEGSINLKEIQIQKNETVVLVIGPEGGLSPREVESAKSAGFTIAHLDMPILRTETAGIVASGIILS